MGWQNFPFKIDVKAGDKKAFCKCGQSKNGPYCDGSHKGTGITPEVVQFTENKTVIICGCRTSKNGIYCDGSHKTLPKV